MDYFIAFGAGLISFLSPCVLPLVPGYISFISGNSLDEILENKKISITPLLFFTFGFSIVFISFGAAATFLGQFVYQDIVLKARQAVAATYVDQVLTIAHASIIQNDYLPEGWEEIGDIPSGPLDSCEKYNSDCSGEIKVIQKGNYLIGMYSNDSELRVSAWRFSNEGSTSRNMSVFGCVSKNGSRSIYKWGKNEYYQGPGWNMQSNPWNACLS